jgi:hypothetical protein
LDPEDVLGPPDFTGVDSDRGAYSLGLGGMLEVGLGECRAQTTGDARPDLQVIEVGGNVEPVHAWARPTPASSALLGESYGPELWIYAGRTSSDGLLDLDAAGLGVAYEFEAVLLVDGSQDYEWHPETPGADVDAIEMLIPVEAVSN